MIEQARAAEAGQAWAAEAEEEAEAAQRLRMEKEMAELMLRAQSDTMRVQQMQAELGVVPPVAPAPQPEAEEALCVVCMDAPKSHVIRPCMHMCTCEACTQQLQEQGAQSCPVCRGPIEGIERVFT